jgi:hypothetical protein
MEVSNNDIGLQDQDLVQTVVSLTGLPDHLIRGELDQILEQSGQNPRNLTLTQLREAMVAYLEAIQAEFFDDSENPLP